MLAWLLNNETDFVLVSHASWLLQNWHLSNFRATFKIVSTYPAVHIEYLSRCVYQIQAFVLSFKTKYLILRCSLIDGTLFKVFNDLKVNRHFFSYTRSLKG